MAKWSTTARQHRATSCVSSEPDTKNLLVVFHSRSGSTAQLRDALIAGATEAAPDTVERRVLGVLDAGPDDVLWADAVLLATPANFGWVAGLMKDFLERIYHPCLDHTRGKPFALIVKGDTDVDGAVGAVERIVVAGMGWKTVQPPLKVVGALAQEHLDAAWEVGASVAAGLDADMY
jgi:hypothetical protein